MPVTSNLNFDTMRAAMVMNQLRPDGVDDVRVVEAMDTVPREDFVPESLRAHAYLDTGVAIGGGRRINPPSATGRLLTELLVHPDEHMLVVGAGRGYAAAVAAMLAESVVAVESDPELAGAARTALAGYPAVTVVEGPLAEGAAASAPYDVILIDGAVDYVPDALVEQLKPGGRIATGIIDRGVSRLAIGARSPGGFGLQSFADAECVRLPGFERVAAFTF